MQRLQLITIIGLCYLSSVLATATPTVMNTIHQAVKTFIQGKIPSYVTVQHIGIKNIDSRLRLTPCDQPLELFLPQEKTIILHTATVGVKCTSPKAWQIYLPVVVKGTYPIVVTTKIITRGTILQAQHLTLQDVAIKQNQPYIYDIQQVLGKVAKRTIRANIPIQAYMLKTPALISKGASVNIIIHTQGIRISTQGTALSNGQLHQRIKVKNNSSNKIVEAFVVDKNTVQVK